jgi:hypothetical protein
LFAQYLTDIGGLTVSDCTHTYNPIEEFVITREEYIFRCTLCGFAQVSFLEQLECTAVAFFIEGAAVIPVR